MLHKLFAARSSRPLDSKHACRLELEALEDRVSPALVVSGTPATPFVVGGSFGSTPASSIFIPQNSPFFEGDGLEYPTSFRGFDNSSDAYTVSVLGANTSGALTPASIAPIVAAAASSANPAQVLGQMQQLVGILSTMTVAQTQNPSQVLNLAVDEVFAAVDAFALSNAQGAGINTSAIQNDLTDHLAAIQNNPVDHTPIGQQLGNTVHNMALFMLAMNHGGT